MLGIYRRRYHPVRRLLRRAVGTRNNGRNQQTSFMVIRYFTTNSQDTYQHEKAAPSPCANKPDRKSIAPRGCVLHRSNTFLGHLVTNTHHLIGA